MILKKIAWVASVTVLVWLAGSTLGAADNQEKGAKVYKDAKCSVCHKIGTAGGKMGPDLTTVGTARDAKWLKAYLMDPKAENPKNKMPKVKVKGADLDDLITYLLSLK